MAPGIGDRPKSLSLVLLLEYHAAALAYDWRERFNLSLRDLRRIGWVEAWWLTSELLRDPYSHVSSALRGDKYVPSAAEDSALALLEGWANAKRGKGKVAISIPRPWIGRPPTYDQPKPTRDDAGRAERRALLEAI